MLKAETVPFHLLKAQFPFSHFRNEIQIYGHSGQNSVAIKVENFGMPALLSQSTALTLEPKFGSC